ncbi:MAG TPA: NfeD family protein [Actinomadura sp.]|jgi:membrane protein implicated in regulation of membrane protease activity|nr:NfeD family protein [Actinomadura sp.]
MEPWAVWMVIAAALGVAELVSLTLSLGLLAVAAVAAGLVGLAGLPPAAQVGVFGIVSVAGLGFVRPIAARHIRQPPTLRSGVAALVGREALTLTKVTKYAGRVRIGAEEWTARPYDPEVVIPEGAAVDVLAIQGATALVYPREVS